MKGNLKTPKNLIYERGFGEMVDALDLGSSFERSISSSLIIPTNAIVAQLVECNPSKVEVAGSRPVYRSLF